MTPRDLGLPFDSFRPGQLETAGRIAGSEKEHVILEAPPGSGKSLLAITAARLLKKLNGSNRTVITATTKQLQSQYEETLGIPLLVGKNNYKCAVLEYRTSCEFGPCAAGRGCSREAKWNVCPYYKAKLKALESPECILNLPYFLNEANHIGQFSGLDFLVIDEAHLLEDALSRFIGTRITFGQLAKFSLGYPVSMDWDYLRDWAKATNSAVNEQFAVRVESLQVDPTVPTEEVTREIVELTYSPWPELLPDFA